jgi:hypothetical protein
VRVFHEKNHVTCDVRPAGVASGLLLRLTRIAIFGLICEICKFIYMDGLCKHVVNIIDLH